MTPKDRRGRERRPTQDAALEAVNRERKHPEGVMPRSHNIAAQEWAHEALQALTPRQRGELLEQALREAG